MITQIPEPGSSKVMFCGDTITFTLLLSQPVEGDAWIRTDLGRANVSRREIIDRVDRDEIRLNEAWHDIKMVRDGNLFSITLPMVEPGHFHAKCFFLERGRATPLWPYGENCTLNVDSSGACSANIIYNAFVRQFGQTKASANQNSSASDKSSEAKQPSDDQKSSASQPEKENNRIIKLLDSQGYTVIPPSGKFRDLVREVDFIFEELGCRILHLLPVHPTPTTYGRMGRYGSPYAALNFTEVDPALAGFDPSATPLEQFMELADAVHFHCGYLILDIAINHTGWASSIHECHPEWLARSEDGTIEVPGAWGVRWEDLTRLDYSKKELWQYMADMFLLWCRRRVDGFRCDAGYMIPAHAWGYIVARVRQEYPDTIFFLEGLGGGIDATRTLLDSANLNWAYSELFQNYDRHQIENYLPRMFELSDRYGLMVNFAETHDNPRLASISHTYSMMRTAICALFSVCGSFGFAAGVEWFAKERINVHESPSLNWGAMENQTGHIQRLNHILREHPTFRHQTSLRLVHVEPPGLIHNCIALLRCHQPTDIYKVSVSSQPTDNNQSTEGDQTTESRLLVLANLDCQNPQAVAWSLNGWGVDPDITLLHDLMTGKPVNINVEQDNCSLTLEPGQVVALSSEKNCSRKIFNPVCKMPVNVICQKLKAKAFKILTTFRGYGDINCLCAAKHDDGYTDKNADCPDKNDGKPNKDYDFPLWEKLFKNPVEFCRSCNPQGRESRVVVWRWGKDERRTVMVPPNFCLMVIAPSYFRADIRAAERKLGRDSTTCKECGFGNEEFTIGYQEALPMESGEFFAIFMPFEPSVGCSGYNRRHHSECTLRVMLFKEKKARESTSTILYLSNDYSLALDAGFTRQEIMNDPSLKLLGFNQKGAMMRAAAWWGKLESRYDALLAANVNPQIPENRWILLARYRIWAIYQGYSRELTLDCLERFTFSYNSSGKWLFNVPTCEGSYFQIEITLGMSQLVNQTVMRIHRKSGEHSPQRCTCGVSEGEAALFTGAQLKEHLLPDDKKVEIIVRPDVESRSFHDTVKAWTGPEHQWPVSVRNINNGFIFDPEQSVNRSLRVQVSSGKFIDQPEWQYMVYHPLEAGRGLDPYSDLFSPGYFASTIRGGETVMFEASTPVCSHNITEPCNNHQTAPFSVIGSESGLFGSKTAPFSDSWSFAHAIKSSLDAFIVERGHNKSVIAGYPWFLDWGRDSLIFCRALIEAERFSDAKDILRLFGSFESNGTLPNMICGKDAANRETSDAPLWFFAACRDLAEKEGYGFLDEQINIAGHENSDSDSGRECTQQPTTQDERTFRDVLISMAHSFIKGTDTGMGIDPETSLFYSPSHFTWMDTNFPACSPRQGYPVEIQALWYYALVFLDRIDNHGSVLNKPAPEKESETVEPLQESLWKKMALDVRQNVIRLFYRGNGGCDKDGFFSDCLHCDTKKSALQALPDDALRPNQLFLITSGLLKDEKISINTLESCMELLVPGAIRSLADRDIKVSLHIYHKYCGKYEGDEDRERKPSYHNGTAWTWQFPVFCEAWAEVFGCGENSAEIEGVTRKNKACQKRLDTGVATARSWLGSSIDLLRKGCAGYTPEILDGDAPHTPRGCDAQAWGSSELVRVWLKLDKMAT